LLRNFTSSSQRRPRGAPFFMCCSSHSPSATCGPASAARSMGLFLACPPTIDAVTGWGVLTPGPPAGPVLTGGLRRSRHLPCGSSACVADSTDDRRTRPGYPGTAKGTPPKTVKPSVTAARCLQSCKARPVLAW
jgi:hypothetical protein